jgi:hypothetical protein
MNTETLCSRHPKVPPRWFYSLMASSLDGWITLFMYLIIDATNSGKIYSKVLMHVINMVRGSLNSH